MGRGGNLFTSLPYVAVEVQYLSQPRIFVGFSESPASPAREAGHCSEEMFFS